MKNWTKSDHFIKSMGDMLGKSFLGVNHAHTADEGAMWRLQRKIAARVFTTSNFRLFTEEIFHKYTMGIADLTKAQGGKCDMHTLASQYTLQSTFDISCGVPLSSFDKELGLKFVKSMDFVFSLITVRIVTKPYFKHFWWCMPSECRFKRDAKAQQIHQESPRWTQFRSKLLHGASCSCSSSATVASDQIEVFDRPVSPLSAEDTNKQQLPHGQAAARDSLDVRSARAPEVEFRMSFELIFDPDMNDRGLGACQLAQLV